MATTRCKDSSLCVRGRWRDQVYGVSRRRFDPPQSEYEGAAVQGFFASLLLISAVALVLLLAFF